ncbi:Maspardin [Chelonia mydas]|uniref:Maspardin n=1 Tax=Chelonia mydas TaxID=8469 RepID=M7CKQ1_CHEMY|nr:Maspardin [Chelonia mydas]
MCCCFQELLERWTPSAGNAHLCDDVVRVYAPSAPTGRRPSTRKRALGPLLTGRTRERGSATDTPPPAAAPRGRSRFTQPQFHLNIMGEIKVSPDYNWFRSTVPLKKIIVDDDDSKVWSLYDAGPKIISFWLMPAFMLKKIVLGNFASGPVDPVMADGIDFMVDRLESLSQSELASRLTLNCQNSYVEPHKIRDIPVTIMDVFDQSALSTEAKEEMYKLYPSARRAHLKTGGNFPYLCRSAEVNVYIQIHLLQFHGTRYAAIDPSMVSAEELEVQKIKLQSSSEQEQQ